MILQRTDITLADAEDAILSTKEVLLQFDARYFLNLFKISKNQIHYCHLFEMVQLIYSSSQLITELIETKKCHGYDLKGNLFDVQKKGLEMMKGIVKHIDLRYKNLNEEVLASTVIGSLNNWPVNNQQGNDNILSNC